MTKHGNADAAWKAVRDCAWSGASYPTDPARRSRLRAALCTQCWPWLEQHRFREEGIWYSGVGQGVAAKGACGTWEKESEG